MLHPRFLTTCVFLPAILIPLILDLRVLWVAVMIPGCLIFSVHELATMLMGSPLMNLSSSSSEGLRFGLVDRWWKLWLIMSCVALFGVILVSGGQNMALIWVGSGLWFVCGNLILSVDASQGVHRLYVSVVSLIYGCFSWLSLWYLFQMGDRFSEYMIFIICVVMGSDTGGFVGGKLLGRHPMAPVLSPNKTWEGAVCAICCATAVGGAYGLWVDILAFGPLMMMTVAGSVAAMTGDLIESALKRYSSVKDSGSLFPGHGGFLDRADGFIVAIPVMWLMFESFVAH